MRVVLVEGLPGSGKSTTAHLLALHLARGGHKVRWVYEHEEPHPILPYSQLIQAMHGAALPPGVFDAALSHWERLLQGSEDWLVLESAFYQMPLHTMLLLDWERERIARYVRSVDAILQPAQPLLILLRHADVGQALSAASRIRGPEFAGFLADRVAGSARGRRLGLAGWPGVLAHFAAYRDLLDELGAGLRTPCLLLDADGDKQAFVARVAAALGLPPPGMLLSPADLAPYAGTYAPDPQGPGDARFVVMPEAGHLTLAGDAPARLLHQEGDCFAVAGTPVRLHFHSRVGGRFERIACSAPLPHLPDHWRRIAT